MGKEEGGMAGRGGGAGAQWRWWAVAAVALVFLRLLGADVGRVVTGLAWPLLVYWLARRFDSQLRGALAAIQERLKRDDIEVGAKAAGVEAKMKIRRLAAEAQPEGFELRLIEQPERNLASVDQMAAEATPTGYKPRLVGESESAAQEEADAVDT
jgi:hypothetical protein